MVGGFVQRQHVIRAEHQLGHAQTGAFATAQHRYFLVDILPLEKERAQKVPQLGANLPNGNTVQGAKNGL